MILCIVFIARPHNIILVLFIVILIIFCKIYIFFTRSCHSVNCRTVFWNCIWAHASTLVHKQFCTAVRRRINRTAARVQRFPTCLLLLWLLLLLFYKYIQYLLLSSSDRVVWILVLLMFTAMFIVKFSHTSVGIIRVQALL